MYYGACAFGNNLIVLCSFYNTQQCYTSTQPLGHFSQITQLANYDHKWTYMSASNGKSTFSTSVKKYKILRLSLVAAQLG